MEDVPTEMLDWSSCSRVEDNRTAIEKALRNRQENLRLFESYFINDWCSSKLTAEDWSFIKEMDKCATVRRIKYAFETMKGKYRELYDIEYTTVSEVDYITLVQLLSKIETKCIRDVDFRFMFAVHTYFSIQFNKLAVDDQIKRLVDKITSPEPSVYAVPYRSLFYHVTGRRWDESVIQNAYQLQVKYDELPRNVQNLRTEPETLIAALMRFLPIDKEYSPNKGIDESAKSLFEMQTRLIYIICNWDVQDQMIKCLTVEEDKLKEINYESIMNAFEQMQSTIITSGKQAVYPGALSRGEPISASQAPSNLYQNIFQLSKDADPPSSGSARTDEREKGGEGI
jgi:hypothetical protein